ncbi:GYD domain-containing protein [Burkholderia sp. LMG 13014]|uniref:GYD domain-containing protein n=1 Tax=Burkholderia sp. LMG 13014 TaxID=2709306 RepID=UPI00196439BA|nr:GYD domain-containing protein [Burkholderia sp. LMG 13014]
MTTYIVLMNWTEQGAQSVKDTVQRARSFQEGAQAMGVTVTSLKWTLGPYDIVATLDAPDDETATRLGLMVAQLGNVRTVSMRAFGEPEMERIVGGMK